MATMEERIPHIRTICEKFLAEGQDAALTYANLTHERDVVPGKDASIEVRTLGSTCLSLIDPCRAVELLHELFDWIGVDKEPRKIRVTERTGSMLFSIWSDGGNSISVYETYLGYVPDLILRLTTLRPGDGAKGVHAVDDDAIREGRRLVPAAKAKLEKIEGLTEAMERLRSATKTAQVWQVRVDEMLTKAGVIADDGRFKPKTAASENASDGQVDVDKVIALEDLSRERPRKYEARVIPQAQFGDTHGSDDAGIALMIEDGWEVMCVSTCPKFGAKTYYLHRQLTT